MILAGDIGGTKTNLAHVAAEGGTLVLRRVSSYPSRSRSSFLDIVRDFTAEHPEAVEAAAFGIAGPVVADRCEATNLPWVVDARTLSSSLGDAPTALLNDLEATAYGVLHLRDNDRLVLQPGEADANGAIAVIAAGTGLGEGGLIPAGSRFIALPSEGGHTDFAPRNELEIDLLRFMLRRHERVSYERLVSGPGLLAIYEFFRERAGNAEPAWLSQRLQAEDPSAVVSHTALEGGDAACRKALELFVSLYGAEAGNLALKLLSRGGVYIAGGIAQKILPALTGGTFLSSFQAKGRFSPLLRRMPLVVVLNQHTALLGAAHRALDLLV